MKKSSCQHGTRALRRHQEGAGDGAEEGQVHRGQGRRRKDVLGRQVGRQGKDGIIGRVCSPTEYNKISSIKPADSEFTYRVTHLVGEKPP